MEEANNLSNVENVKNKAEKKSSNIGMYVGIGLAALIALAVAVTAVLMNLNNGTDNDIEAIESVVGENTELKSGSVTTTIDGKSVTYQAAYIVDGIEAKISSGAYESVTDDEVVFLVVNGGGLVIDGDVTVNKSGSEDFAGRGDDYSFYGMNSAIVVVGENSSVEINGATINTSVSGANAVVATDGGTVVVSETEIYTTKDNSRGLHATYGGTINADGVTISTQGGSCAALATDRGEGSVTAMNMTLSTAGAGSPLVYSTGDITVTNSTGTATGAQIAVVEGKNSINLEGCDFSANGDGNRNNVDNAGVMIYQSMSGDAGVGTGSFSATDCNLVILDSSSVYGSTPFFFITNTNATISLDDITISFSDNEYFVSALGTSEWGKSGSNGGNVTITMNNTTATNTKIEKDSISSVSGI